MAVGYVDCDITIFKKCKTIILSLLISNKQTHIHVHTYIHTHWVLYIQILIRRRRLKHTRTRTIIEQSPICLNPSPHGQPAGRPAGRCTPCLVSLYIYFWLCLYLYMHAFTSFHLYSRFVTYHIFTNRQAGWHAAACSVYSLYLYYRVRPRES